MTYPVGDAPDGSWQWGSRYGQDITEQSAKATMAGGVLVKWDKAQENHHTNVSIDSPLWKTLDGNEESTFPRTNLSYGAANATASGGSGDNTHRHDMTKVPDYQPGGNNLQLGFIKIQTHCKLNAVGFITGDSETWLSVQAAYVAVYKMDETTGNLTRLWTSADIQTQVTTKNTETRISLPTPINAQQGETYAVGIVTQVAGLQKPGSLLCTTQTDIARGSTAASQYPRRQFGFVTGMSSGPPAATVNESSINYSGSTILPFFFLRRATPSA